MPTTNSNCIPVAFPPCETDVYNYTDFASFPTAGVLDKLYIDMATATSYFWNGTQYVASGASADIYVDGGAYASTTTTLTQTLTDNDAGTPDVVMPVTNASTTQTGVITATTQTIGGEKTIDSGTDDVSGLTFSRLDGNSPKEDASTTTPLAYDNLTGEVVPFQLPKTDYKAQAPGFLGKVDGGTLAWSFLSTANGFDYFAYITPVYTALNTTLNTPTSGESFKVDIDATYSMLFDDLSLKNYRAYGVMFGYGARLNDSILPTIKEGDNINRDIGTSFSRTLVNASTTPDFYFRFTIQVPAGQETVASMNGYGINIYLNRFNAIYQEVNI